MTPIDETPVITPLGVATLMGVIAHVARPVWACWSDLTQEMWFWDNRHIRRRPTPTNGFKAVSGFTGLNRQHYCHIGRYVQNGWLPENYDPADPKTWNV